VLACILLNGKVGYYLYDGSQVPVTAMHFKKPLPIQGAVADELKQQSSMVLYLLMVDGYVDMFKETDCTSLADLKAGCVVSAKMWHGVDLKVTTETKTETKTDTDTEMDYWTSVEHTEAAGRFTTFTFCVSLQFPVVTVYSLWRV
jgi:hypothetical protein